MIENIWIDFEKLPSDMLEMLLYCDCSDSERTILSDDAVLCICKVLANRRNSEHPSEVVDVKQKWEEFREHFLNDTED